ncbi:DNA-directed RNA polymerase III subunit RPC7-like [Anoplolepis gracilipes]|uniref:DNA-directed RNA polymerase III subunit RPC7-like n=1 Tax=Anoplolepis gracilipes TaxID=354296 RepID=UPI003B9ED397
MAGRNKGKSGMSFSMEQLGFSKGEMLPTPVLQPSPSYPMLDHKPLPIQITTEMSYLVELKRDFTEYMRESPNNVQAVILNEDIERYCEDYEEAIARYNRSEYESKYDWSRMPMELQLQLSRKRKIQQESARPNKKRKIIEVDIENKLIELEKKENTQQLDTEEVEEEEEDEDEQREMSERVKDEEEIDEEMDDGTDYANDYFDTGENYCSEDDNDDGPVF